MDIRRNIVTDDASLQDVMRQLNEGVFGIVLVVDGSGRLAGVMTDGDVRRAILGGATPSSPAADFMNRKFLSAPAASDRHKALALLSENRRHLPLLDEAGRPVDLLSWAQLWRLGVSAPHLGGNEMKYVNDCLANGWISSQGEYVRLFESALAEQVGVEHAVATSSGTTALHLALTALGIGAGDEVIVPNITFGACGNTVIHCGARPVFVDVDPGTWTIDLQKAAAAVTGRTRAIMAVHLYGHPCDMDAVLELARRHKLAVVEDCAEAFGARYKGRPVGGIGDVSCFSFFANKVITTGEGGAVLTRDAGLADRVRMLSNHGTKPDRRYWHVAPGFNYRMTNLQAAVGLAQLERADKFLELRRTIADGYERGLADIVGIEPQKKMPWAEPICWLYTVLVDARVLKLGRDDLMRGLQALGIDSRPIFPPLNEQPAFGDAGQDFPVSRRLAADGVSLPTSNAMTAAEVERVCAAVRQVAEKSAFYERAAGTQGAEMARKERL